MSNTGRITELALDYAREMQKSKDEADREQGAEWERLILLDSEENLSPEQSRAIFEAGRAMARRLAAGSEG
jgi:hypothetical protein